MKKLMLAGLILASGQMAVAVNWVLVEDSPNYIFYVDTDSVQVGRFSNGNKFYTFWTRVDNKNPQADDGIYSAKALDHIDCLARKSTHSMVIGYNAYGRVIGQDNNYVSINSSATWKYIVPGSIGQAKIDFLCSRVK